MNQRARDKPGRQGQLPGAKGITEEETGPLPERSPFPPFLEQHGLSIVDVAQAAGVRLAVVWRIAHRQAVSPASAEAVRRGIFQLTGEKYHGQIEVYREDMER